MAQTLPDNYTGLARNSRARIQEIARLTPAFAQIMQEHSMRASISIAYEDCGATCFTTVKVCMITDINYGELKVTLREGVRFQI